MITDCDVFHECNKGGGKLEETGKPLCMHSQGRHCWGGNI